MATDNIEAKGNCRDDTDDEIEEQQPPVAELYGQEDEKESRHCHGVFFDDEPSKAGQGSAQTYPSKFFYPHNEKEDDDAGFLVSVVEMIIIVVIPFWEAALSIVSDVVKKSRPVEADITMSYVFFFFLVGRKRKKN